MMLRSFLREGRTRGTTLRRWLNGTLILLGMTLILGSCLFLSITFPS